MMLGWLTSFDVESPYRPRRVEVVHSVVTGERSDYLWVRVDPPIAPGEAGNKDELAFVLLAPRHEGHPLTFPVGESVHVYVCTVRGATTDVPSEVDPSDIEIRHWGVVTSSHGSAPSA